MHAKLALIAVIAASRCQQQPQATDVPCDAPVVALHAYSQCNADGHWHVVTDGLSSCPPDRIGRERLTDTKTSQSCREDAGPPLSLAQQAALVEAKLPPLRGDETCRSPVKDQRLITHPCVAGSWEYHARNRYRCLDGTFRYDAVDKIQRTNTACDRIGPAPDLKQLL